ncbi:RdgB/HAM1 family non-canonical purine NTP pyrophosphatase [Nitrososphaera sp.]|uniref:RdgB/HAM1 family non-canonical purine NTP pyrophosphatase n=1 Tax=Nitrososphaera sp. TaxID=1971748 RepID=UPI00307D6F68
MVGSAAATITFASTNQNKFKEVQAILALHGIAADFARAELVEIQSDSLAEIAREKARSAYAIVKRPVIVEDDGLFIDALGGFPGQYSSYVFKTIGNAGVLKLLSGNDRRREASFRSVIAFCGNDKIETFEASVQGRISENGAAAGGWGYDPIFIPEGAGGRTYAQLGSEKGDYSHRRKALDSFAGWFLINRRNTL